MKADIIQRLPVLTIGMAGVLGLCVIAQAAPLPADDFNDGVLNPSLWTSSGPVTESGGVVAVGGGNGGTNGQLDSTSSATYERLTFRLNNFYDSRSVGDYTAYTIGYAGYIGSEWILVRTDNTGGSGLVIEVNTPNDGSGGGVPFTNISIADHNFHDLIFDFQWSASELRVTIDDLNNGVGLDVDTSTTNPNLIPSTAMPFNVTGQAYDPNYQPWNVDWINVPVPEPTSIALLSLGGLGLLRRRRYK